MVQIINITKMPEEKVPPIEDIEETEDIYIPEESGGIIDKILEKYGFKKAQEEGVDKFLAGKSSKEDLFNLPGSQLAKLVRHYAEGNFGLAALPELLEKSLDIPAKKAREIAEELKNKILVNIQPQKSLPTEPSIQEKEGSIAEKLPRASKPTPAKNTIQKPDSYREPVK